MCVEGAWPRLSSAPSTPKLFFYANFKFKLALSPVCWGSSQEVGCVCEQPLGFLPLPFLARTSPLAFCRGGLPMSLFERSCSHVAWHTREEIDNDAYFNYSYHCTVVGIIKYAKIIPFQRAVFWKNEAQPGPSIARPPYDASSPLCLTSLL